MLSYQVSFRVKPEAPLDSCDSLFVHLLSWDPPMLPLLAVQNIIFLLLCALLITISHKNMHTKWKKHSQLFPTHALHLDNLHWSLSRWFCCIFMFCLRTNLKLLILLHFSLEYFDLPLKPNTAGSTQQVVSSNWSVLNNSCWPHNYYE